MEYTKKTARNMKSYIALGMSLEEIIKAQRGSKEEPGTDGINKRLGRIKQILSIYQELLHDLAEENGNECGLDDEEIEELKSFLNLFRI